MCRRQQSKSRGKIGHRQLAPARQAALGRERDRASEREHCNGAAGPSMVRNVEGRGGGGQRTLQPYLECDPKKRAGLVAPSQARSTCTKESN